MPPKKNAGAAKSSKGKSSEESSGGKTEKKGGTSVKVKMHFNIFGIYLIATCVSHVIGLSMIDYSSYKCIKIDFYY